MRRKRPCARAMSLLFGNRRPPPPVKAFDNVLLRANRISRRMSRRRASSLILDGCRGGGRRGFGFISASENNLGGHPEGDQYTDDCALANCLLRAAEHTVAHESNACPGHLARALPYYSHRSFCDALLAILWELLRCEAYRAIAEFRSTAR